MNTSAEDLEFEIGGIKIAIDILEKQLKKLLARHKYHVDKVYKEVYGECYCIYEKGELVTNPKCPRHGN